jgi:hypothetical protein
MQIYPTWLYKKVKNEMVSMLVKNEFEHEAIGEGWADTPAAFEEQAPASDDDKPKRSRKKSE